MSLRNGDELSEKGNAGKYALAGVRGRLCDESTQAPASDSCGSDDRRQDHLNPQVGSGTSPFSGLVPTPRASAAGAGEQALDARTNAAKDRREVQLTDQITRTQGRDRPWLVPMVFSPC
jgi:hypothetical protein